jgi:hypothetical protein
VLQRQAVRVAPVQNIYADDASMVCPTGVKLCGQKRLPAEVSYVCCSFNRCRGAGSAKAELRYGKNEQLRRIAQEIIVEQQAEIAVMQRQQTLRPQ